MENGEKPKNLSNGTSWFLWGGVSGLFAIMSGNNIVFIICGIIACLLIFIGLGKRKIFDEMYLTESSDQSNQKIDEPAALLNDADDDAEEKKDEPTPSEDH